MKIISLTGNEYIKVYKNRWYILLILLAISVNIFFFQMERHRKDQLLLDNIDVYRSIVDEFADMPIELVEEKVTRKMDLYGIHSELDMLIMQIDYISEGENGEILNEADREYKEHLDNTLEELHKKYPDIIRDYYEGTADTYSGSINIDSYLIDKVNHDIKHINEYDEYIRSMDERAENITGISIFSDENSFAHRNILKTARDFKGNKGITLTYDITDGIDSIIDYSFTDILILCIILLTCILLISHEKDRDLLRLTRTTKHGRLPFIISKLIFLIVNSTMITLLLYGSNIIMADYMYGIGDMQRLVQSIPSFKLLTWVISVGEFLTIYILFKIVMVILISLIIMYLFIMIRQSAVAYMTVAALIGLSYAAYQVLPVNSYINHVKFINLFNFLEAGRLFTGYQNLNFFGYPLALRNIFVFLVPVLSLIFIVLIIKGYLGSRQWSAAVLVRILDVLKKKFDGIYCHSSMLLHETQRVLVTHKGIVILAVLALFLYNGVSDNIVVLNQEDVIYRDYINNWGGVVTDDTLELVSEERAFLNSIPERMQTAAEQLDTGEITRREYNGIINRLSVYGEKERGFSRVERQVEGLEFVLESLGYSVWLMNTAGYERLFGTRRFTQDIYNMLLALLAIILIISPIYSYENRKRLRHITRSCSRGYGYLITARMITGLLVVISVMAVVYGIQLYDIGRLYGFKGISAPIQSIEAFQGIEAELSIAGYIIMTMIIRFIGYSLAAIVILLISSLAKNEAVAVIVSISAVCAPIIAYQLGIVSIVNITLIPLLSVNMLFYGNRIEVVSTLLLITVGSLITGTVMYYIKYNIYAGKWSKNSQ